MFACSEEESGRDNSFIGFSKDVSNFSEVFLGETLTGFLEKDSKIKLIRTVVPVRCHIIDDFLIDVQIGLSRGAYLQ